MSRETEADRIARERRSQNEARQKRQQAEEAYLEETDRKSNTRKIIEEIPGVLQLLADLGYPDTVDLDVEVKVPLLVLVSYFVSPYRRRIKAGWYLSEYERPFYDGLQTIKFYLVSDGSICFSAGDYLGGNVWRPQELSHPNFDNSRSRVLMGLRKLRQELEARLNK